MYIWSWMRTLSAGLRRRDEGATMVEYGLLITVIALVVLAGAFILGTTVLGWFNDASSMTVH